MNYYFCSLILSKSMIKNHGEKIAITVGSEAISYSRMFAKMEEYSELMKVAAGERVVIFSENRPAWIYSFLAIWKKAAIAVPIDFMATVSEVAYILNDSTPSLVFVSANKKDQLEQAMTQAGIMAQLVVIDEYEKVRQDHTSVSSLPSYELDSTAILIYTSGTTGAPKGVMLSYRNLMANLNGVVNKIKIFTKDSRVMILLPLHHIFPLLGSLVAPLHAGGSVAISPSMASDDIINTLNHNNITIVIGVPRLYAAIRKGIMVKIEQSKVAKALFALARKINSRKFSRLIFSSVHKKFGGEIKHLVSGGAALDPEVGNDFKTLGFEVLEGFGMTEAAPMITFTRPGRVRIGSPGEALFDTEIKIIDGEIAAKGDNIMKGYYNNPEATREVIKDGWLHTGDLGYIDKDGYLYITGRKKEIIILSNGKNVNPNELEEELLASELVSDCGVFFHEEQIHAIILAKTGEETSGPIYEKIREEVIEPLNQKVSSYKRIMKFYLTDKELPRTRLGKLQRFKLDAYATETKAEDDLTPEKELTEELRIIADFLTAEKGKKVKPHHHLEFDLAMDSLDRVGLQVFLNQSFGVDIETADLMKFQTVEKLSEYISEKKTKMEEGKTDWTSILREKVSFKMPVSWYPTRIAMRSSKFLFKLYFRYRSKGLENIPEGPCIIAPNHQSFFDGLFVTSLLRTKQIGKTFFYAKAQHVESPFMKFLANKNNVIVVDLNKNLKESIQKLAEVLRHHKNLIIFPEGTRSVNGTIGQFKKTFAILSRELNIPVVPVAISGAIEALPKGSKFPRPWKKVQVEFLAPVYPADNSYEQIANIVRNRIVDTM